ncbi:hypothetical protein FGG08_004937 [Glutinoglossum americanum]|uniref:rRNA methyltransferase 2, mitochondrial n=1 Tax=Glutinoglossum americanum TaxID=1670608 RepID=A0A9P8HVH5_9PEZI|nr:hypothetical protein FGG08_004937 [Glutinoglossum americanum]
MTISWINGRPLDGGLEDWLPHHLLEFWDGQMLRPYKVDYQSDGLGVRPARRRIFEVLELRKIRLPRSEHDRLWTGLKLDAVATFNATAEATAPGLLMLSRRIIRTLANSILLDRPALITLTCHVRPDRVAPLGVLFSSSSGRWQTRQSRDRFSREAKVQGLKSRAAFKLLEVGQPIYLWRRTRINAKFKIFKKGQTVVDLVAIDRTSPGGRVIGIDIIPAQPPRGVSTIQGNFLSPAVQESVRHFLLDPDRGRARRPVVFSGAELAEETTEDELDEMGRGHVELERRADVQTEDEGGRGAGDVPSSSGRRQGRREKDEAAGRTVDVVLSDMSEPWPQTSGFWKRSLSDPYFRMMNTSGMSFRDHAGSMDLCNAALLFSLDTLRVGGHLVCKFYQGAEDRLLESRLRKVFQSVHREKPESSRSVGFPPPIFSGRAWLVAVCIR